MRRSIMRAGIERLAALCVILFPLTGVADDASFVRESCAGCHSVERPDYEALGPAERLERRAPPLYHAGSKYREPWLAQWLQDPQPLHPEGYYRQPDIVTAAETSDAIAGGGLTHPALDETRARSVAAYLMSLRPHEDALAAIDYEAGSVPQRMGMLDFRRFKGCGACHQDQPGTGGISGPELHTAWARLDPRFMVSYITDPTLWDPNSMMPAADMNEDAVHKLVDYLHTLTEE